MTVEGATSAKTEDAPHPDKSCSRAVQPAGSATGEK